MVTGEVMLASASDIYDAMQNGLIDELDKFYDNVGYYLDRREACPVWDRYDLYYLGGGNSGYVSIIYDLEFDVKFAVKVGLIMRKLVSVLYCGMESLLKD